jgi:hypothetical protein
MPLAPQQTIVYQPYNGGNAPFTMHPRQESPRMSQTANTQLYNNANQNAFLATTGSAIHSNFSFPNSFSNSGVINPGTSVMPSTMTPLLTQQTPNIPPLRQSLIDFSRPTRNIFPIDSYMIKTKFD